MTLPVGSPNSPASASRPNANIVPNTMVPISEKTVARTIGQRDGSATAYIPAGETASDDDILSAIELKVPMSGKTTQIVTLEDGSRIVLIEPRLRAQAEGDTHVPTTIAKAYVDRRADEAHGKVREAKLAEARSFGIIALLRDAGQTPEQTPATKPTNPTAAPVTHANHKKASKALDAALKHVAQIERALQGSTALNAKPTNPTAAPVISAKHKKEGAAALDAALKYVHQVEEALGGPPATKGVIHY